MLSVCIYVRPPKQPHSDQVLQALCCLPPLLDAPKITSPYPRAPASTATTPSHPITPGAVLQVPTLAHVAMRTHPP